MLYPRLWDGCGFPYLSNWLKDIARSSRSSKVRSKGSGLPLYQEGAANAPKTIANLREVVEGGEFTEAAWRVLSDPASRNEIRDAVVTRYFPRQREILAAGGNRDMEDDGMDESSEPEIHCAREAAFRKTIRDVYDHRCAVCGLRVKLDTEETRPDRPRPRKKVLVEAAHIIPFKISHNDHPSNGVALCRNHHWAMDNLLLAPCPDKAYPWGIWKVSVTLDDRIRDNEFSVAYRNRPLIPPSERKFFPAKEALEWREACLV